MNQAEVTGALFELAAQGLCTRDDAIIALGIWTTANVHPGLMGELVEDFHLDLEHYRGIFVSAGIEPPWEATVES